MIKANKLHSRRTQRVRSKLQKVSARPRLSVFRSEKHIYAQIIDDVAGKTLVAASTLEKDLRGKLKTGANIAAATAIGQLVAERALKKNVKEVQFDRGGNQYHGRLKALAEAARAAGLSF
ncbi:MAG: 50S ribosomal protein L18 [Alphaproteobacteria bacterium]|nr:50S ribosomal protein L18 [Alphaproteobacteria bacterium]